MSRTAWIHKSQCLLNIWAVLFKNTFVFLPVVCPLALSNSLALRNTADSGKRDLRAAANREIPAAHQKRDLQP